MVQLLNLLFHQGAQNFRLVIYNLGSSKATENRLSVAVKFKTAKLGHALDTEFSGFCSV
jgi:hypothetical protein